jgi:hypothetical protein
VRVQLEPRQRCVDLGLTLSSPCYDRMPTRYALDLEALKGSVTVETLKEPCVLRPLIKPSGSPSAS